MIAVTGAEPSPISELGSARNGLADPNPPEVEGHPGLHFGLSSRVRCGGSNLKVIIDESKCVGAGQCVWVAPQVFDQRESDGIVVLLQAEPPADLHDFVREAVAVCPAAAIRIEE